MCIRDRTYGSVEKFNEKIIAIVDDILLYTGSVVKNNPMVIPAVGNILEMVIFILCELIIVNN